MKGLIALAALAAGVTLVATVDSLPLPLLLVIGAALWALVAWTLRSEGQARRDQRVDEHEEEKERWAA